MKTRRKFIATFGALSVASLAGCSADDEGTNTPADDGDTNTPTETTTSAEYTHDADETAVIGAETEAIAVSVESAERYDQLNGITRVLSPDGVFIAITLSLENRGDSPMSMGTDTLNLVDKEGREFSTDSDAFGAPNSDSRIEAEQMQYEDLQPGLSTTVAVVFDVPQSGTYNLRVSPPFDMDSDQPHTILIAV